MAEIYRVSIIAACCVVLALDRGRIPGAYDEWAWLYLIAAGAIVAWYLTASYTALKVFGAVISGVTVLRIFALVHYEGWQRVAGIALNILILIFTQEFVARRREHTRQALV